MIITINNLKAGLDWWRAGGWPRDIHNADYYDIYKVRAAGPTDEWWDATVNRLSKWRAIRGPKPPNTKAEICRRGTRVLDEIKKHYGNLIRKQGGEPSIADCQWEEVGALFCLASGIKTAWPVFASKMCHFLFPRLFIPMDNYATSVFEYEFYWRGMRDEWNRMKERNEARRLLSEAIVSDERLHPLYPFETKIMELSHMGWKHG